MATKRNIGRQRLKDVRATKRSKGKRSHRALPGDVRAIRKRMGLSQSGFAGVLGVSTRTLQDWEQGRRRPTGPARALLRVAHRHPNALLR
jgi:putative transcriptional regulator